jgi:hypothetical protein
MMRRYLKSSPNARSLLRAFIGSNIFALVISGIYEYLSLRGTADPHLAVFVLAFTWILGVAGIALSEVIWGVGIRKRVLFASAAAVILGAVLFGLNVTVSHLAKADPTRSDSSGQNEPHPFCPPGTVVCVDTRGGGTVKDVHFDRTHTCRPTRVLGVGGKGESSNITFENTFDECK